MDIKKAVSAIIPTQVERVARVERSIKTDSTTDRDANGQQAQGGSDQNKEPLSNEEMEKVLEYLKNLTVVKDHQLQVLLVMREKKKFVLLQEPNGTIVRRIPEHELRSVLLPAGEDKGVLLRRSA